MATPREVYEGLVGVNSSLGVGDIAERLSKFVNDRLEQEGMKLSDPIVVTLVQAEEFLRELSDEIADEDEFDKDDDADDEAADEDKVLDDDDEDFDNIDLDEDEEIQG